MIAAVDRSTPEGERNVAIIEVLYGCGLRASELVNLKLSEIFCQKRRLILINTKQESITQLLSENHP